MTAIRIGFAIGLSLLAAGCNTPDQPTKKGNVTAARHMRVGSNIPQRQDADSTSAVVGGDMERMGETQGRLNAGNIGGR